MHRHAPVGHVRRARGAGGRRAASAGRRASGRIPFAEFHTLPGDTPNIETTLKAEEIITAIDLPASPYAEHSVYTKVRDRASYAFALVSVAACWRWTATRSRRARIALGGVAHKPWRLPEAEALLIGKAATKDNFLPVAERILQGAQGYEHNTFKIELGKRAVVRACSSPKARQPSTANGGRRTR